MANTVIALKKSAVPSAAPSNLANGELAINYADGKLYYKHANGSIIAFNTSGGNSYGTVNANGTLIVASVSSDILTLIPGNNIQITGDAINDRITISATGGGTGGASVNIGDNPPVSPNVGDLWWSSVFGSMFIYYNDGTSTQWVETTPGSIFANSVELIAIAAFNKANNALANTSDAVFSGNLKITGTLTVGTNTVNITSNSITIGTLNVGAAIASSYDMANSANILAYNTGIGANAFAAATIAGANTAVGAGANNYLLATIAGANTAVGTGANNYLLTTLAGANNYLLATIAGANTAVGTGANNYLLAIIAGANTAVGAGANNYLLATIAGANTAVGTGANNFASATIAGANTAVGTGANNYLLAIIAGANTAIGTGANNYLLSIIAGANTAVGTGANNYLLTTLSGANTAVGAGANNWSNTKLSNSTTTLAGTLTITGNTVASNVLVSGGIQPTSNGNYGTAGQILTSNGASGVYWQTLSVSAFPSGTAMLFVQTAAPTGWTKSTTHNDKALRVVSGTASSGGSVAFSTAFASQAVSGTVGSTTISTTTMPSHNHSASVSGGIYAWTGAGSGGSLFGDGVRPFDYVTVTVGSTGGGGSHNHTFSGTAINLAVNYVDTIIATKD